MSLYLQKSTEAESNWKGSKGRMTEVWGSGLKREVQGAKEVCGKVRFGSEVVKGMLESHSQAGEAR